MNKEKKGQKEIKEVKTTSSGCKKNYLLVLVLLVMAALASIGYFGYQSLMDKIDAAEEKGDRVVAKLDSLQRRSEQNQDVLQDLQIEIQKSNLAEEKIWKPIVIEHLVRMADLTLKTSGDVKKALLFLLAAQKSAKGPGLASVNHAINKDITSLEATPAVDYSALILKARGLGQRLDVLPMSADRFVKGKKEEVQDQKEPVAKKIWQRLFKSVKEALKNIVEVRRVGAKPLPLPGQEEILRLNIKMNLLQAEAAILERRDELYQACLREVEITVKRYFSLNSKGSAGIISSVQELKKINLQPKTFTNISSVSAIKVFMKKNSFGAAKKEPKKVAPAPKTTQPQGTRKI